MQPVATLGAKKNILQKQFPTILGLVVLVVGLIAGAAFMATGGVIEFSPRATPQTTPKNVKISNVTDSGFTVSFLTDEQTAGFVKYGTSANDIKSQAGDDRDQLSGAVGKFSMHHITVRGLEAGKEYFFTLGTGSNAAFDDNGKPFTITTAKRSGTPTAAKTIYGTVTVESGAPADGAVVYVTLPGVGEQSSLVKSSGSWAIPLSNARTADGSGYAAIQDSDQLTIFVQGVLASQTLQAQVAVSEAQPVATLAFGQSGTLPAQSQTTQTLGTTQATPQPTPDTISNNPSPTPLAVGGGLTNLVSTSSSTVASNSGTTASGARASSASASLNSTSSASSGATITSPTTIDLTKTALQEVTTGQPIITGKAAPNVKIKIQVNSETQINYELVSDANGGFTLDISKLENDPTLEPGEHTVTYSYVDPQTGKEVSKTQTFYVKGTTSTTSSTSQQLAQANTTTTRTTTTTTGTGGTVPFGSGNPFPITGTGSAQTSTSSTKTSTSSATKGATSSSRTSLPSTASGIPRSGSVETTLALIIGGLFFIGAGTWSYWAAQEIEAE